VLQLRKSDESQIVFGVSVWNRVLGPIAAVLGVILVCVGSDLATMLKLPPDWNAGGQFIRVVGIALLGIGVGVAFYSHELTIDVVQRTYCLRRGFGVWAASSTGGLDDFDFLSLEAIEMPDGWTDYGTEEVWHLYLHWKHPPRRQLILGRWKLGRGIEARRCLKYLSARLGLKAVRFGGRPADNIIVRSPAAGEVPAALDKTTARKTFRLGDYVPSRASFGASLVMVGTGGIALGVFFLSGLGSGYGGAFCVVFGAVVVCVGLAVFILGQR